MLLMKMAYDALGRRVETWNYTATSSCGSGQPVHTRHIYAGLETVEEYVACTTGSPGGGGPTTWNLAREFIWGNAFPEPLVLIDHTSAGDQPANAPEILHYVRDALGSVVGLTDAGNPSALPKLVERYDYDPYGRTYIERWDQSQNGGSGGWVRVSASYYGNPFAWTAQRYDAGVKLYSFFARTYSPDLGRWLQRDPLGYVQGVNLYQYVSSQPTAMIDPLGFQAVRGGPLQPREFSDDGGGGFVGPPNPDGPPSPEPCGGSGQGGGIVGPPAPPTGPTGPWSPPTGGGYPGDDFVNRLLEWLKTYDWSNYAELYSLTMIGDLEYSWWSWWWSMFTRGLNQRQKHELLIYVLSTLPMGVTNSKANVDTVWHWAQMLSNNYSGALTLSKTLLDETLVGGLTDEGGGLVWATLDYGEGADHLRHFLTAAAYSDEYGVVGDIGVLVGGTLKELGDTIVHCVQAVVGGAPDFDSLSDLQANSAGSVWGLGGMRNDPSEMLIPAPVPVERRPGPIEHGWW